jgi:hypothetical protein
MVKGGACGGALGWNEEHFVLRLVSFQPEVLY